MKNSVRIIMAGCAAAGAITGSVAMNWYLNNNPQQTTPTNTKEKTEEKVAVKIACLDTESNTDPVLAWIPPG